MTMVLIIKATYMPDIVERYYLSLEYLDFSFIFILYAPAGPNKCVSNISS